MPARISLRCIVTSYSSQHNELVDIIGATIMGTGGDKSPPPNFLVGGPAMYWSPQLLVITFSIMREICMKHARCSL